MVWLQWLERRFRPAEGWLPLLLMAGLAYVVLATIAAVEWTLQTPLSIRLAATGLILATILAYRPIGSRLAWALISAYGLVLTALTLGRLWPPLATLITDWPAASTLVRQNAALALDRIAGWTRAVLTDQTSTETLVFSAGLALAGWLLMAYAAWAIFRQQRALPPLTLLGLALASSSYLGGAPLWPTALFVGLAVMLIAVVNFTAIEQKWQRHGVDYSGEIWRDLLGISLAVALLLLTTSLIVPAVNVRALSQRLWDQPAVLEAEERLAQAFAGVRTQPRPLSGAGLASGRGLPQSFLLGNPPELNETPVMTATVSGPVPTGVHWRGRSFDIYTGRGWATSDERRQPLSADTPIPLPDAVARQPISQVVNWLPDDGGARYTLGLPRQFDQTVRVHWRGVNDLSWVQGEGAHYRARSLVSVADPAALQQATLADTPPAIIARYTQLPDGIPRRVFALAQQVAGAPHLAQRPYEQALALERFLRQYPYSLDVPLPPPGTDPVDYFLFELQSGYCDYYASAMVIMARSLGLPARLAIGYLPQPANEQAYQTVFQIDAHSWAEIYLGHYGWIEFEPTASFPTRVPEPLTSSEADPLDAASTLVPPPATVKRPPAAPLWLGLAIAAATAFLLYWWRRQRQKAALDKLSQAYAALQRSAQRLGLSVKPSQTPIEFGAALQTGLLALQDRPLLNRLQPTALAHHAAEISAAFAAHQYRRAEPAGQELPAVLERWQRWQLRLWLLAVARRLLTT
ncbi:MAG: transglutaminase domain-containing protein [Candidatus Promineifilaceae bacterium]|nr:transglutaminase domain-containing protein [Candidatus Promineifilaceae bacterium]